MARTSIVRIERFVSASLYGFNCQLASRKCLSIENFNGSTIIIAETARHRSRCFIFMSGKSVQYCLAGFLRGALFC